MFFIVDISIESFEKAELHAHLEGTVDSKLLRTLAKKNGILLNQPIVLKSGASFLPPKDRLLLSPFSGSFHDFISYYLKISECIRSAEDIVTIAEAYAESACSQNISYSELYVSASTLQNLFGFPLEDLAEGLKEAERLSRDSYQVELAWIFDIVRNSSFPAEEVVRMAEDCRRWGANVVAIGLAGLEAGFPARNFREPFELARALGFDLLAHAGETAGPDSIRETIAQLSPSRIGHGVRAVEDARLLEELAESEIILEVCPWSNVCLQLYNGPNDHPLGQLVEAGVKVVISSDDPGIFAYNLVDNFQFALDSGLSAEAVLEIAQRSLTVRFR